jgi:NAD+ synthase
MPNGEQKDISDSQKVAEILGIRNYTVNIKGAFDGEIEALKAAGVEPGKDAIINTPPRLRMTTLYAIAQSLPNGGRVTNTCNKSEDYVGYSTKYGDAAGDVSLLQDFTVTEVLQIGEYLGLPNELVHKTPSDGLSGMSDEDKLGFKYAQLDEYISDSNADIPADVRESIDRKHVANLHKLQLMPAYKRH